MPEIQRQIQLGKQGITENFISTLKNHFKKCKTVRISVLKSAGHEKQKVNEYSKRIIEELGKNYVSRVIGFTIVVRKFRKDVR